MAYNGLSFSDQGPVMTGTWYNPSNGDSFTVEDSYFQDNQYMVKTTDGRLLDYNFMQNYVKSDVPIKKQESKPIETVNTNNDILPEDVELLSGNLHNSIKTPIYEPQQSPDMQIIKRAVGEKSTPKIKTSFEWNSFPEKELNMIIDIMNVSIDDVVKFYVDKLDKDTVIEAIKKDLQSYIEKKLKPIQEVKEISKEPKTKKTKK